MPEGNIPSVFVSSTCFDLSQVRADLRDFLISSGLDPVLSEYNSFPVNPDSSTVENCLEAVKRRADIFVLIVGGRYGSIGEGEKSITNLEYLQAKAKGIPVYVFIDKRVLNALPIWKKNPDGNFEDIVDSAKVFEFVDSLKDSSRHWIYPFENAQDIVSILRQQFAYLFMDCLVIRKKIKGSELPPGHLELSSESLRLIIERPGAWEYRLFSQVLSDGIKASREVRRDYEYGLVYEKKYLLSNIDELSRWAKIKFDEARALIDNSMKLLDVLEEAVGAPGEPGNPEHIVYVANKLVEVYTNLLRWISDCKSMVAEDNYKRFVELISIIPSNAIREIEEFSQELKSRLEGAFEQLETGTEEPIELEIMLNITAPDLSELQEEIERLKREEGFGW